MATLRTEETFSTAPFWVELAKKHNVRLPLWRMKPTTGGMRRFLRKIGRDPSWYLELSQEKTLKKAVENCRDWPLRGWAGVCLEWLDEEEECSVLTVAQPESKRKRS